jgi:hypothetical protein
MVHDAVAAPTLSCWNGDIVTELVYVTKAKATLAKQMRQRTPLMPSEMNSFSSFLLFGISHHFVVYETDIDKRFMKPQSILLVIAIFPANEN